MRKRTIVGLLVLGCAWIPGGAAAQDGGIRGVVMDQDFEVPLPGVKVRVSETGQETVTSSGGAFSLQGLEPGSYTVLFSKTGYARGTKPGVVVVPGQLAEADLSLAGEYEEMNELVVRDIQLGGASEVGLLNLRLESSALMDSVGADLMGKAGASDAAQALRLVSGATVQDGKYAVIRGLPDRYVSSQMNGVRLPTADADKRAVQLDQFPAALIESVQVTKTFTPDQQGDASGGAVNVVLKGLPDGPVLQGGFGIEANSQVIEKRNDFLTYKGGGVDYWGKDGGGRNIPPPDGSVGGRPAIPLNSSVGTSRGTAPSSYSWGAGVGNLIKFDSGLKVGGLANMYYKRKASTYSGGQQNKYASYLPSDPTYLPPSMLGDPHLLPEVLGDSGNNPYVNGAADFRTELYDAEQSVDQVKWGVLGTFGIETENHQLSLLYMQTHVAEDKTTLLEDTRGKAFFDPGNQNPVTAPYNRSQALDYRERDTDTLQLGGHHVLPFPDWVDGDFFELLDPEIDWYAAASSAAMDNPDKRLFADRWTPERTQTNRHGQVRITPPTYAGVTPGENINLGYFQRIWKNIEEDSDQYAANAKWPFKQWTGSEGYLKAGLFGDRVERAFDQTSYSNEGDSQFRQGLDWGKFWSDTWMVDPTTPVVKSLYDAGYDGRQDISAWYGMVDLPLCSFINFVGGARFESTELSVDSRPSSSFARYFDTDTLGWVTLQGSDAQHVKYAQDDVLPSLGVELRPLEKVTLRATYAQTVARQTFKELSPIQQQEYFGGDVFVGNPGLKMSALENYDLRLDYSPYPGGLLSFSWFYKSIKDPIEYIQRQVEFTFTQPVNYPEGTMQGYEAELRQQLGKWWNPLEGLAIGLNATLIDSEVTLPEDEYGSFVASGVYTPFRTRKMMCTPDYLFNANLTYDIPHWGTRLALFYNYTGETLVSGESIVLSNAKHSPALYALPYGTLNFSLSQKLGEHWTLKFKIKNITNPEIREEYRSESYADTAIRSSYTKGTDFSVGVTAAW